MKQLIAILPLTLTTLAVSCGGGGGGSGDTGTITPGVSAPSAVVYGADRIIYLKDVPIEGNLPSAAGDAATWTVSPALPPGLGLDDSTGEITGTPAAQTARASYTVTATNSAGMDSAEIVIAVELPPRFAYAANRIDNTVSQYVVDPETGRILPNGFFGSLLVQVAPQRAIAHPTGRWLYTPNLGNPGAVSPNISVYTIDQSSGRIGPGIPAGTGDGPFDMDFTPSGLNAYVAAEGSNAIWEYEVHPQTGALSLMSAPITDGSRPTGIRVHPSGRFAYVAYNGSSRIVTYDIDQATGALSLNSSLTLQADPRHLVMDADGERLYISDDSFRLLLQFEIDQVSGALTLTGNRPIGGLPTALTLHPTGAWIYAARANGTLRAWSIDADTGALILADNNVATGTDPVEISFDPAGRFAYVTNSGSNDVSTFKVDAATGELEELGRTRTRATPRGFTTTSGIDRAVHEPRFLYAANEDSDTVTSYAVSAATGQLTPIGGSPVLTGAGPRSIASDPAGRWLYTIDAVDRSISFYALDPVSGAPTQIGIPHVFPDGGMPRSIAVDSSGRFAFVTTTAGRVEAYHIDLEMNVGELIYKFGTSSLGLNPDAIAVDPTGQFIYVANTDSSTVVAIRFDQGHLFGSNANGWIVSKNETVVSGEVTRIRFSPSGERAYLTIAGDIDQVVPADIDPVHGTLTLGAVGSTDGNDPVSATVHPNGRFAYAALAGGGVAGFGIDQATGSLTKAFEIMVGLNPIDLVVDPSGRFLFVANEGGDDISLFAIDAETGMLTVDGSFSTDVAPQAIELVSGLRQ